MSDFSFGWNRIKNIAGFSVDGLTPTQPMSAPLTLPTTGVSSHTDWSSLHYYVSFQLYNGTTLTVDGNTLFALDNFSFGDTQTLNIGSQSSGAGAGKVTFDPLHLSFSQLDLDPKLFQMLASGTPFKEVDVLGYKTDAHSHSSHLAIDYSFGLVAGKTLTIDNTGISQLDLEYGREQLRDYAQNKNGSFPTTPTDLGGWDRVHNVTDIPGGSTILAAAATSSTTAPLTLPTTGVSNQTGPSSLHYYVSFELQNGKMLTVDGDTLFALDSFSFSDTQTLNIGSQSSGAGAGKVTFNPLHLSFSQLDLDPELFQMLASGTPFKEVDVLGYKTDAHSHSSHLAVDYSFGLVAGKTLTIDNTGISQLDLEYGREQLRDYVQNKNGSFPTTPTDLGGWDRVHNVSWLSSESSIPAAAATSSTTAPLTLPTTGVSNQTGPSSLHYYVSFELQNGKMLTVDGDTLFALDSFSFSDTQTLNIGSQSSGAGAGKVTFDPLHLSFSQLDLDPKLFQMLASGTPFKEVDVLGYKTDAHSSHLAVDYSFGLVAGKTLTIDNTGISQLDLEYGSEQLRDYAQNKNGSFPTTPTDLGGWDRVHNVTDIPGGSTILAAATTSSATAPLTLPTTGVSNQTGPSSLHYYVSFELQNGKMLTVDGDTLFALDSFSFSDTQTLNIGSQSSGAGAGKVTFDPLHLSFSQLDLDPKLFQMLASGTPFKEVDVLGYKVDAHSSHLAVDYSFGLVAGKTLTIDNTGISQLDLEYGREQLRDYAQNKNGSFPTTPTDLGGWDRVHNVTDIPGGSTILAAATTSSATAPLTLPTTGVSNQTGPSSLHYYVSFELQNGKMLTVDGDTLFALDSFSFSDTQTLNIGSQSSGAGAGKVAFNPLHLSFSQLDLDPELFQMLASGTPFKEVDVLGYKTDAHSHSSHLAVDYSFGLVAGKTLTIDNTGISQLDLEYGREQLRDYVQNKNGSFPTTPTDLGGWDRVHNVSWLSGESSIPAAATTSSTTAPLTLPTTGVSNQTGPSSLHYYVSFELQNGKMLTVNGDTLFAPDSFSFSDTQTLNIGSQSSGAGAGKVAFDPLQLNFSQLNLDPKLFQMLASGTPFKEVDVLGYKVDAHSSHLAVDYSFGLAAVKTLTVDPSGITRFSLEYGSEQIHVISAPVNDTVHLHTDLLLA